MAWRHVIGLGPSGVLGHDRERIDGLIGLRYFATESRGVALAEGVRAIFESLI
jgi:hypothetical protein